MATPLYIEIKFVMTFINRAKSFDKKASTSQIVDHLQQNIS